MRDDLDQQMDQLRASVVAMGERADEMLAGALQGLADDDNRALEAVIAADRAVDRAYEQIQQGVLALVALHSPVGRDLRLATALIHVSLHLERMADYAVNSARTIQRATDLTPDANLAEQLLEMGGIARDVGQAAMQAFVHEDAELAHTVPRMDDGVDRLDVGIFHRLVRLAASDEQRLTWATTMIPLARHVERYADHGVDIAEQTIFVTTGRTVEFARHGRA